MKRGIIFQFQKLNLLAENKLGQPGFNLHRPSLVPEGNGGFRIRHAANALAVPKGYNPDPLNSSTYRHHLSAQPSGSTLLLHFPAPLFGYSFRFNASMVCLMSWVDFE